MTEAQLITYTGLLAFALIVPPFIALLKVAGLPALAGNRQNLPAMPEWGNRALRAQRNLVDSMVPFMAIVVAANMADVSNDATRLGMALFFWSRVAHAVVYILGIPYLRTAVWLVGISGMFRVARELVPLYTPGLFISDLF